jgi:hypothetical protein
MRSLRELALVACISAALAACGGEDAPEPKTPAPPGAPKTLAERPCPTDSVLTFEDFGGPFLYSWCTGCHSSDMPEGMRQSAPLDVDFDTLEDARAWADRIWARAGDHNVTMPPIGGPDEEERGMLGEWLACGAPSLSDPPAQ